MKTAQRVQLVATAVVALLALSGCAGTSTSATATDTGNDTTQSGSLTITDSWVKSADSGMTAAFGILENTGTEDITVLSASTAASAMVELHETAMNDAGEIVMQQKDGGFVIPAGTTFELAPGGNHIMMMGLSSPIVAGDEVTFTLTLSDGSTLEFTAPAKDYSGANENYVGGDGMDMGN